MLNPVRVPPSLMGPVTRVPPAAGSAEVGVPDGSREAAG